MENSPARLRQSKNWLFCPEKHRSLARQKRECGCGSLAAAFLALASAFYHCGLILQVRQDCPSYKSIQILGLQLTKWHWEILPGSNDGEIK